MIQFALALLLALSISFAAYQTRDLSRDGALAAAVLGTLVYGFGGWQWALVLLTFFLASSLLSRAMLQFGKLPIEKYSKGSRRDAGQVLGNGGVAGLFVLLHLFFPDSSLPWLGFAGAVAAVNADTWATELGVLNPGPPRSITRLNRFVEPGTSGGVSVVGTIAAALGALVVAGLAAWLDGSVATHIFWPVFVGGLLGALFDSLLGATVQGMYRCTRDGVETEQHPLHRCGAATIQVRGWAWLNNDWVNFGCGLCGALMTWGLSATTLLH